MNLTLPTQDQVTLLGLLTYKAEFNALIEKRIHELEAKLATPAAVTAPQRTRQRTTATAKRSAVAQKTTRPPLSAAAKENIAAAQRKRWAAIRAQSGRKPMGRAAQMEGDHLERTRQHGRQTRSAARRSR
jgi:hypothetical protein